MFKSNYYHLLFLSALFCANSINVFCRSSSSTYHYPENSVSDPFVFSIGGSITPKPYNWHFDSSSNTSHFFLSIPHHSIPSNTMDTSSHTNNNPISSAALHTQLPEVANHTNYAPATVQSEQSSLPSVHQHPQSLVNTCSLFPSNTTPQHNNAYFNSSTNTFMPPFMLAGWDPNNSTDVFDQDSYLADHITDYNNKNVNHLTLSISDESILSNTTNSAGSVNSFVVPQQHPHHSQQHQNHTIDTSANTNSHNWAPVVTNANWNVTPQPYFGGPQTNVNNRNCNPNNNYNHHHHSQQHQKHNINNTNRPITILNNGMDASVNPNNNNTNSITLPISSKKGDHNDAGATNTSWNTYNDSFMEVDNQDFNSTSANTVNNEVVHGARNMENNPVKTKKEKTAKTYTCPFPNCQKVCYTAAKFKYHKDTHTLPHKCTFCDKGFASRSNLTRHIRTHTGETPYQCDVCLKYFRYSSNLNNHIRTVHQKLRPHECNICHKRFKERGRLKTHIKTHIKIHDNEKSFKCSSCTKCFTRKDYLKNHNRTHTGEKPYKCEYQNCNKRYTRKSTLNTHIKRIHLKIFQ